MFMDASACQTEQMSAVFGLGNKAHGLSTVQTLYPTQRVVSQLESSMFTLSKSAWRLPRALSLARPSAPSVCAAATSFASCALPRRSKKKLMKRENLSLRCLNSTAGTFPFCSLDRNWNTPLTQVLQPWFARRQSLLVRRPILHWICLPQCVQFLAHHPARPGRRCTRKLLGRANKAGE